MILQTGIHLHPATVIAILILTKMTASAHAVVGAAIASRIPDPRISIPLILLSHVICDLPDHWDTGENWQKKSVAKIFSDTMIDLILGYLLVGVVFLWWLHSDPATIILGVFVSQLFDFLEVPYFFLHWKFAPWSWINNFNHLFHKKILTINFTLVKQVIFAGIVILWSVIK